MKAYEEVQIHIELLANLQSELGNYLIFSISKKVKHLGKCSKKCDDTKIII